MTDWANSGAPSGTRVLADTPFLPGLRCCCPAIYTITHHRIAIRDDPLTTRPWPLGLWPGRVDPAGSRWGVSIVRECSGSDHDWVPEMGAALVGRRGDRSSGGRRG